MNGGQLWARVGYAARADHVGKPQRIHRITGGQTFTGPLGTQTWFTACGMLYYGNAVSDPESHDRDCGNCLRRGGEG